MTGTGVYATDEDIAAMKAVMNAPYIVVGGLPPESPQVVCHKLALARGLPEITGYYGCDLRTKEFVTS